MHVQKGNGGGEWKWTSSSCSDTQSLNVGRFRVHAICCDGDFGEVTVSVDGFPNRKIHVDYENETLDEAILRMMNFILKSFDHSSTMLKRLEDARNVIKDEVDYN